MTPYGTRVYTCYDIDGLDLTVARGIKQINMKKDTLPNLSTKAARKATINFNLFFFVFPLCLTVRFVPFPSQTSHNCTVLLS